MLQSSLLVDSYVCHAEVNAILNTNHASTMGQVSLFSVQLLPIVINFSI